MKKKKKTSKFGQEIIKGLNEILAHQRGEIELRTTVRKIKIKRSKKVKKQSKSTLIAPGSG